MRTRKQSGNGAELPFWVYPKWVLREPNLSHACKLVLGLIVILHEGKEGCICSNQRLADELAMDVSSVRQVLHRLRKSGYLEPVKTSFPHKFVGKRLVPTYHTKPAGVILYNADVIPYNTSVIGLHIEQKVIEDNERESREAGSILDEQKIAAITEAVVAGGGASRQEVREEISSVLALIANGLCETPSAWDRFIATRIASNRRNRRQIEGPKAKPASEPVSQFLKTY